MGGRLFERFQERVRRFVVRLFKATEDDDLPTRFKGRARKIVLHEANLVNFQDPPLAIIRPRRREWPLFVELETDGNPFDNLHIGVAVALNFLARRAFAARRIFACAFQCLNQSARERRLANGVGTG